MNTTPAPQDDSPSVFSAIDDTAAVWVARRDRGLTPAEQDEFFQWLAADPRHGARLARHQRGWSELAQLAQWRPEHGAEPNADLLAPPLRPRRRRARILRWVVPLTLAAAAVIAVGLFPLDRPARPAAPVATESAGYRQQILDDGTLVELNGGAELSVAFTPAERRVQLTHGEALFSVAKNPARPFVVEAAGVIVRAVGTAFNVRLGPAEVEVLVTEGRVQVDRPAAPLPAATLVDAGHRLAVPFAGEPPAVAPVTRDEIDRALAWQPRLLEFVSTPLAEVAVEFNRRNRMQLVIADSALAGLPIGASFRSDNLDGFVRLLEASFGVKAGRDEGTITLRRAH